MDVATAYVASEKARALEIYERGEDGASGIAQLKRLETDAPSLATLVDGAYQTALGELNASQERYQRLQVVASTVAALNEAVPERVEFVDALPKTSVGKMDKKVMRVTYR